jgi:hypothetical protein
MDNIDNIKDLSKAFIVVTGRLDNVDVMLSDVFVEDIKKQGIFLSIIGVQASVDVKNLDKLADYSYSFDLASGVPDGIQDVIKQAHGCDTFPN